MRSRLLLLACLAVGCGTPSPPTAVTAEPARSASTLGEVAAEAPPIADVEPPKEPPREPPRFPHTPEQVAKLRALLDAALAAPEARSLTSGVRVVDAATGELVYRHDDDRPLVPASNTKLFTTFAALRALGATARAKVVFSLSGARKAKDRADALVIDGAAVPFGAPFATLDAALAPVVAGLRQRSVRRIDRLVITSPAIVSPERFQELDLAVHRDKTATAVRKALGRAGIAVGRLSDAPAPGGELLAELDGPTVADWIAPVNQLSHNGLADALAIHLGHASGGAPSLIAGESVVARELDRAGIHGASLADGSGLSRKNRASAHAITDLLVAARGDDAFVASLAVTGVVGTLSGRMKDTPLAGRIRAKTGTLKEVIATSGYLDHPADGRRYVFAIVSNGVEEGSGPNVRAAHDRWLTLVASEWWH